MKKHYDKQNQVYLSPKELIHKYNFSNADLRELYNFIPKNIVPLKTAHGDNLYLETDYLDPLIYDYQALYDQYSSFFSEKDYVISEIHGSLSTEGVHSSRKTIEKIIETKESSNEVEQNIINLHECIELIKTLDITPENVKLVYDTLTYNIDLKTNKLDGVNYRLDEVQIGNSAKGVSSKKVNQMMDELLDFCNELLIINPDEDMNLTTTLMYTNIIHYQFVYIHPYYDRNGRMARLLSQWVGFKLNPESKHIAVSEVISYDKNNYYNAIQNVRNSYNQQDATHFVDYMLKAQIKYMDTFLKIDKVRFELQDNLITLSDKELSYIKMIYLSNLKDKKFGYKDFSELLVINDELKTKQGIFKLLNNLVDKGVLESANAKNNKTKFYWAKDFNQEIESAPPLTAKTVMGSAPDNTEISSEMEM